MVRAWFALVRVARNGNSGHEIVHAALRLSRFENVKSGGRVFGNVLFQSVT